MYNYIEYGRDLVADVSGDTRGDFKRLLVSQLSGNRDEVMIVELSKAEEDAKNIFEVCAILLNYL